MKTSTFRIKEVTEYNELVRPLVYDLKNCYVVQKQVFGFLWVSVISFNNPTSAIDFVNTVHQRELGLPELLSAQISDVGTSNYVETRGQELSAVVYPKEQCAQLNVYLSPIK
ncbi:hypothetical protein IR148_00550 [Dysgonomonas mossii]|uniref:Uncharacterized protein n=1 Tax=Dysgonomonas mossii TaxID=163665 RepID=A0A4Y9IPM9_9BACT|nr:hypothetical protein [Dysgonomonas mossii]MBF0759531.1 hypothetical protein [Dysgonomonas mossii]TFU90497.1 hypothetical protein E4T88_00545 [Dysgonomonas mossii]